MVKQWKQQIKAIQNWDNLKTFKKTPEYNHRKSSKTTRGQKHDKEYNTTRERILESWEDYIIYSPDI